MQASAADTVTAPRVCPSCHKASVSSFCSGAENNPIPVCDCLKGEVGRCWAMVTLGGFVVAVLSIGLMILVKP